MKRIRVASVLAIATTVLALTSMDASARTHRLPHGHVWHGSRTQLPSGSTINVRLDTKLDTDDINAGDMWSGTITQPVTDGNRIAIPAGSRVEGVVTNAHEGTHSTPAELDLAVRSVSVNGRSFALNADAPPIVAGSKRAKKLGVIAGGAAVGALIGHGVAKDSHGALIGGLLGGATAYGVTRHSMRSMVLKPGTDLSFTTQNDVAVDY